MKDDAYGIAETEAERLRQQYQKRHPDAARDCSLLRSSIGQLKTKSRRQALILIRRMEQLDDALLAVKHQITALQKSIDIDQRRDGVMRVEEHARKDRIRQERLNELKRIIEERRLRRVRMVNDDDGT